MCGVIGFFGEGHAAERCAQVEKGMERLRRRGPDAGGMWSDETDGIYFGHRRLSIIDVSEAADQPLRITGGETTIVFNGEIYNHHELRSSLKLRGRRFATQSDTEVLLHLYEVYGLEMFGLIRGMYAFAIWDGNKKELVIARDPLGIKPLYYRITDHGVWIGSQVGALRAAEPDGLSLDAAGRVGFFLWGHVPEPFTYFQEIRSLPAGEVWTIRKGLAIKKRRFFDPSDLFRLMGDETSLRDGILSSVRAHLEADVDVGVFLSAGLDSATLTAMISEIRSSPIKAMTIGFRELAGTRGDEIGASQLLAKHYRCNHFVEKIGQADFEESLDDILTEMDQPTIDGINTYFVSRLCSRSGIKVAISGLGGDELFGGYSGFTRIPQMVRRMRYISSHSAWADTVARMTLPLCRGLGVPKAAGLVKWGGTLGSAYLLNRCLYLPWEIEEFLEPEFVRTGWERLAVLDEIDGQIREIKSERWKLSWLEMNYYMKAQLLRDSDWAGMAHSVEIRVPLCDVQLIRIVAGMRRLPTKGDMARSPVRALPASILDRPKSGFSVPVGKWMQSISGGDEVGNRSWSRFVDQVAMRNLSSSGEGRVR